MNGVGGRRQAPDGERLLTDETSLVTAACEMRRTAVPVELEMEDMNSVAAGCGMEGVQKKEIEIAEKMYDQQDATAHESMRLEWDRRCYFQDGLRQVDYVLAYEDESAGGVCETPTSMESTDSEEDRNSTVIKRADNIDGKLEAGRNGAQSAVAMSHKRQALNHAEKRAQRRKHFLNNLRKMGLQVEHRTAELGNTRYLLLHAPFELLEKQAQLLSVKLPVKRSDVDVRQIPSMQMSKLPSRRTERTVLPGIVDRWLTKLKIFDFDEKTNKLLCEPDFFTAPYSSDRRKQFVNWDRPDLLFPNAERCRMVYDLLIRARYDSGASDDEAHYRVGVERLLANGTFSSAYPLHQEFRSRLDMRDEDLTQRELLYTKWASWRNFYKYQPLDLVKRYFGTKVGLYFAWLGYYTRALYPAAFLGFLAVVFAVYRIDDDHVSNDICGNMPDAIGPRTLICPNCDHHSCDYQYLNSSCLYAKVSYLFDNTATVVFAACMTVWATLFLEGWKRYHAEVAWKWGLMDFVVEEDTVRPEFQLQVKTHRFNPISQKEEPYLSVGKKIKNCFCSGATVAFFVCLVLAVVFGVMVYRVIAYRLLNRFDDETLDAFSFLIVSTTAASLNLCVIMLMNYFYNQLAHWLTRWECPRTQADFDNQYTFKVFLFQFVNYYSSLFYIAFFKGAFTQVPGNWSQLFGIRLEGCDSAGCFAELVIQLSIIMCGKQFFSAFMETLYPKIMSRIREWRFLVADDNVKSDRKAKPKEARKKRMNRWEADYYLSPVYDQFLFDEYLEMVLQFGFVTLFVAAFPLAPLFAVINNIMEIRLDAYKFLASMQRPLPAQAKNIGVWLNILDALSKCSVTINALVIAFTSDFVPKTYWYIAHEFTMDGYVDSSLSYFNTSEFDNISQWSNHENVTMCRYRAYHRYPCPHGQPDFTFNDEKCSSKYDFSAEWWRIFACRLLFVVFFEHFVFVLKSVIAYLIPDIPTKIFIQQQREKYLARQALLAQGGGSANRGQERLESECGQDSEDTAYQPGSDFTSGRSRASVASTAITVIPNLKSPPDGTRLLNLGSGLSGGVSQQSLHSNVSTDSFQTAQDSSVLDLTLTTKDR